MSAWIDAHIFQIAVVLLVYLFLAWLVGLLRWLGRKWRTRKEHHE